MKVAFVDPSRRVPSYDADLTGALARAGAEVHFHTAPPLFYEPAQPAEVVEHRTFGRLLDRAVGRRAQRAAGLRRALRMMYPAELWQFCQWVRLEAPTVAHWQWSLAPVADALAFRWLRRQGVPVVFTVHNILPHEPRRWHAAAFRALYRRADALIVHSESTRVRLAALLAGPGGPAERPPIHVVPMAPPEAADADAAPHEAADADAAPRYAADAEIARRDMARVALGIPAERPVVLFFGERRAYKGYDVLLEAVRSLAAAGRPVLLLAAGDRLKTSRESAAAGDLEWRAEDAARAASGSHSEVRHSLQNASSSRRRVPGGEPSLLERPGPLPEAEVGLYFAAADVVALPYLDTCDSAVLASALGSGRAVVASDVGGLREAAGEAGVFVRPGDAPALAAALERVLSDRQLRRRLEAAASAKARGWTWDDAARATLEVYAAVSHRKAAGTAAPGGASPDVGAHGLPARSNRSGGLRLNGSGSAVAAESAPKVSVVMPVLNGMPDLAKSLAFLLEGTYPRDRLEVVVADGGSTDGSRELLDVLAGRDPRLRWVTNPRRTTPAGLNLALGQSTGEVIVRLDAHAWPAADYVERCVDTLLRTGAAAVGGPMVGRGTTDFGRAVALAWKSPFGSGGAGYRSGHSGPTDTVYLGAWRRGTLESLGGFDERLPRNQDYELLQRIRARGGLVWLDPSIRTRTATRSSVTRLARQYFNYGRGRAGTVARHPQSLRARQALPAALLAALGLSVVASVPAPRLGQRLLGWTLGAYALANAVFSLAMLRREMPGVVARLPLVFAVMHLCWGAGFWSGMADELGSGRRRSRGYATAEGVTRATGTEEEAWPSDDEAPQEEVGAGLDS